MYEIWLGLNIVFERALAVLPWLLGALAIWIALVAAALMRGQARWRSTLPASVMIGATIAALGLWFVPLMMKSSIYEMAHWVDWANLIALSAAVGGVAFAFIWPLLATVACPDGAEPPCGASR